MAITATACTVTLDLLPRENNQWVQMSPSRILIEQADAELAGDRRHLWVSALGARQLLPIDEQASADQPETIVIGVDQDTGDDGLGFAAQVAADLIAHPDRFAVKRRPEFALRLREDDPAADIAASLDTREPDDLRDAVRSALAS